MVNLNGIKHTNAVWKELHEKKILRVQVSLFEIVCYASNGQQNEPFAFIHTSKISFLFELLQSMVWVVSIICRGWWVEWDIGESALELSRSTEKDRKREKRKKGDKKREYKDKLILQVNDGS